ncbi:MAG: insulinase family protein [Treponema sp.]|jgi:Zn-dependent M16 (insulinase) family peptidase|nr:insulinase family protein [Treponema sp.]
MTSNLQKGQVLESGFEILDIVDCGELNAAGIWARHRKSGAEVFHVLNDDSENLFAFAFATAPEDSTGVAHILEHSTLCGSENYPLKDAFLILAQGSLQTYLNAWTFPDKTVYPASSVNEQDYFNLMSVYADAVFRPLLSEWTFMQEGHRLEYAGEQKEPREKSDNLSITGVVYNEMKGAYSSMDTFAGLWSIKSVLPDTPYAYESGGDPDRIPDLDWEGLKEFHRTRYSPANCRIFLAGNIPTEKQLKFLDEKYLSALPPGEAAPPIGKAERWKQPRKIVVPCPAGAETKPHAILSWLCSDSLDACEALALTALAEILMGHDGSPLTMALVASGLGEDLSPASGFEGGLRETVFSIGLRGAAEQPGKSLDETGGQIEAFILNELNKLVSGNIPKEEVEAGLLSMEFSHREIRRSGGPYSLVWLQRSLRGWLHGAKPWERLLFVPAFTELKRRIAENSRYFESLIQKYFLDNPHRAFIMLEPEQDFLSKKEALLAEELAARARGLSEDKKQDIKLKSAELERMQEAPDNPEALKTIPHLSRKDISTDVEYIDRKIFDASGIPVITHELFTNGITYADMAFPVDIIPPADYPWLYFFSRAAVSMGLPGMNYGAVSSLLARTTGGFYALLETGSHAPGTGRTVPLPSGILDIAGRDWIIYRVKALDEKIGPSFDLALRLIAEADFSDLRRIRDLTLEMKNDIDSNFAPMGHLYASIWSERHFSRSKAVGELWSGITQLKFAHQLAVMDAAEIGDKLTGIRDTLVSHAGMIANLCGSAAALAAALPCLEKQFSRFGAPRPRNPDSQNIEPFLAVSGLDPAGSACGADGARKTFDGGAASAAAGPTVFASASLQVGFAAQTLRAAPYGSYQQAAELVLAHQLSTGALWEDIRMKGGAYGAFAQPDALEGTFSFSTYRDPNPLRSLDAFAALFRETAKLTPDEDTLVKAIIGVYARETRPRTSADKSITDFLRFLYGIEDVHRSRRLRDLTALQPDDIGRVLENLAAQEGDRFPVILAGKGAAEKAAARIGAEVKELPV